MNASPKKQDTARAFGNDFAQTMQAFYQEHPASMETTQIANTSPLYIAHQIEVGHTFPYLDRALDALETEPAYKDTALSYRQRLEEIRPQQSERVASALTTEEVATPVDGRDAPNSLGEPPNDMGAYVPPQDASKEPSPTEPTITAKYYPINETAARRAKEAISFFDYKPGSATAEYQQLVDEAVQIAEHQKSRVDPMHHEKIARMLDTYARKLAENMNNGYAITARVPSVMITGPANFPVRAKEKQNAAQHKNMQERRDIQALLDKIRSAGTGGISADDHNAIPKLQEKLSSLVQSQKTMKAVNAYYRKNQTLDGCPHINSDQIVQLKADLERYGQGKNAKPFSLSSNNAEIRRLEARIRELTQRAETVFSGWRFQGGKVEANKSDNRLQIFFDGKPDEIARAELKSNGFRWAPSVGAWQRQLTRNAFLAANKIKCIQPLTGEKPTELQKRAQPETDKAQQPSAQETNPLDSPESNSTDLEKPHAQLNSKEDNPLYVETNIGLVPLEDYLHIQAIQYGFDDYKDLLANGYSIEIEGHTLTEIESQTVNSRASGKNEVSAAENFTVAEQDIDPHLAHDLPAQDISFPSL